MSVYLGPLGDTKSRCAACDTLTQQYDMVWAEVDLYVCYHCAEQPKPWRSRFTCESVR